MANISEYEICFKNNEGRYFAKIKDSNEEKEITKEEFQKWIRKVIFLGLKK